MKVLRERRLWSAIRCTVIGDPMFSITHSRVACRLARVGVSTSVNRGSFGPRTDEKATSFATSSATVVPKSD
ncbi:hypothetical protein [Streptomyces niveus]|uniref:hypothetical protein n=1 Tax=Streptomyces niveus TaxID=193462 RepID=UPI001F46FCC8|nr:hypothetical protein [Streptomyces niveus]